MAIQMRYASSFGGSYTTVGSSDLICEMKLRTSYSAPAQLTWTMIAAQHSTPIPHLAYVQMYDDRDAGASFSAPHFAGYVETITPGNTTNVVFYEALDPTARATSEFYVMSQPWVEADPTTDPPEEGVAAFPRIVFNVTIDNDDDWALQRSKGTLSGSFPVFDNQHTVGEIFAILFNDQLVPLRYYGAAPATGDPYVQAELDDLDYIPQEKVVIESEGLRPALDRILQAWYPGHRLLWNPSDQKWHFIDITASSATTLTLNDHSTADGTPETQIVSFSLDRSIANRYTAVKIYGPQTQTANIASTEYALSGSYSASAGGAGATGLVPFDAGTVLESVGGYDIKAHAAFQIADPNMRKMSRTLPETIFVRMGQFWWQAVKSPTLQMKWDGELLGVEPTGGGTPTDIAGPLIADGEWVTILGTYFDFQNGVAYTGGPTYIKRSDPLTTSIGDVTYFPPTHVRIVYAYLDAPITVRWPTTGFSGTAYDDAGLTNELKLYDEMLAVGVNRIGQPITTQTRLDRFEILASRIHAERKDIVYIGGLTLDTSDVDLARALDTKINIAAVGSDELALTTGWEDIGAIVTEIEYDFENDLTMLSFSNDHQALIGVDIDRLKQDLRIRAAEFVQYYNVQHITETRVGMRGNTYNEIVGVNVTAWGQWLDEFGGIQ